MSCKKKVADVSGQASGRLRRPPRQRSPRGAVGAEVPPPPIMIQFIYENVVRSKACDYHHTILDYSFWPPFGFAWLLRWLYIVFSVYAGEIADRGSCFWYFRQWRFNRNDIVLACYIAGLCYAFERYAAVLTDPGIPSNCAYHHGQWIDITSPSACVSCCQCQSLVRTTCAC